MTLPRKLKKVNGYVYSAFMGALPYETRKDKEQLLALLQIYCRGIERGALPHPPWKKNFSLRRASIRELHVREALFEYIRDNHRHYLPAVDALMKNIALKGKKKIFSMSTKELQKLLGEEYFAGELINTPNSWNS